MRMRNERVSNDYEGITGIDEDEDGIPAAYDSMTDSKAKSGSAQLSTFIGPPKQLWEASSTKPRSLPHPVSQWWNVLPEVLNLFIALLFTVLGIGIVLLNGRKQDENVWGKKVVEASRLATTLWPILFAGILGSCLKALAGWRAEKGARLGVLEHLMGSQTVVGAVRSVITLRTISSFTAGLILLWALSPLGSQAVLRSVYLEDRPFANNQSISYFNHSVGFDTANTQLTSVAGFTTSAAIVNTLYGSALFSRDAGTQYADVTGNFTDKNFLSSSTADAWGNVRIPRLQSLPDYDQKDPEKWIGVPFQSRVVNYTSLLGIPVSTSFNNTPRNMQSGNFTFTIGANYHDFKCAEWEKFLRSNASAWMSENYRKMATRYNSSLDKAPYDEALASLFPWRNSGDVAANSSKPGGFFLDTIDPLNKNLEATKTNVPLRHIVFGTRGDTIISTTKCEVTTVYVNANVTCERVGGSSTPCAVQAMRLMPYADRSTSTNLTGFEFSTQAIALNFPIAVNDPIKQHASTSSFTEVFIADPRTAFLTFDMKSTELGELPIDLFAQRFGLLFNTYWRATVTPKAIIAGFDAYAPDNPTDKLNVTALFKSSTEPIYALSVNWIVIFFIANFVMVLAATAALWLRLITKSPEILGFVSSLLRDSPYFPSNEPVSSTLHGAERARMMYDYWVRLGDVRDGDEVGRIAFASADMSTAIKYERPYR